MHFVKINNYYFLVVIIILFDNLDPKYFKVFNLL